MVYLVNILSSFIIIIYIHSNSCILGSIPNSHRQIEPELMRRLINDNRIDNIISSGVETKGLGLLNTRTPVGSLSEADQLKCNDICYIHKISKNRRLLNTNYFQAKC